MCSAVCNTNSILFSHPVAKLIINLSKFTLMPRSCQRAAEQHRKCISSVFWQLPFSPSLHFDTFQHSFCAPHSHWVQPIGETKETSVRQGRARPSSNHGQEGGATLLYYRLPLSASYTQLPWLPLPLWVLWSVCVVMCVNKFNFRLSFSLSRYPLLCHPTLPHWHPV